MKNIITTLFIAILSISLYAQVPGIGQVPMGINYQAVARDASGAIIENGQVSIRFKILDGSATGTELFEEQHVTSTNQFGLFNAIIGSINTTNFSNIEWRTGDRFLKVELFESNSWQEIGTQQILAVPYATVAGNGKSVNVNGFESMNFYGENGNLNAIVGRTSLNDGGMSFRDENGVTKGLLSSNNGAGELVLKGNNGNNNVILGFNSAGGNYGRLTIHGTDGTQKINLGVNAGNVGFINTTGDICANGVVCANIKNFRMDHPTRPDKEIWYACIEGPEAAAYERGTAQLINGEVTIQFSEHFELVANPATMTVILTPNDASSKGLAAFEKTDKGFTVKELFNGTGNYSFDWESKCVRKGYEDFEVIRDKAEMQKMLGETPKE